MSRYSIISLSRADTMAQGRAGRELCAANRSGVSAGGNSASSQQRSSKAGADPTRGSLRSHRAGRRKGHGGKAASPCLRQSRAPAADRALQNFGRARREESGAGLAGGSAGCSQPSPGGGKSEAESERKGSGAEPAAHPAPGSRLRSRSKFACTRGRGGGRGESSSPPALKTKRVEAGCVNSRENSLMF